jgi:tRNA pseudouridine13 synthase
LNEGSYLILKIKKFDISTLKFIRMLVNGTKLTYKDVGYAGLKDRSATTVQYFSVPKEYEKEILRNLTIPKVELLDMVYHKSPIRVGQLKGNRFAIILNRVTPQAEIQIRRIASQMSKQGIPNYYGFQRFGESGKRYLEGREIAHSGRGVKSVGERLSVSAYQGYLFNQWLLNRISISKIVNNNSVERASEILSYPMELIEVLKEQKNFFKLFIGDHMRAYPYGKSYLIQEFNISTAEFLSGKESPTGLICGTKTDRAISDARYLEMEFDDQELYCLDGRRRYAWIWPKDLIFNYNKSRRQLKFHFYLPKGSYATTFLEEIAKMGLLKGL